MSRPGYQRLLRLRNILSRVGAASWRWQVTENAGGVVRELVCDDSASTGVFATGATLSPHARAIALFHPGLLDEQTQLDDLAALALERLEVAAWTLQRLQRRAYRLKQAEHYADCRSLATEILKCRDLLDRVCFPGDDFAGWASLSAPWPPDDPGQEGPD